MPNIYILTQAERLSRFYIVTRDGRYSYGWVEAESEGDAKMIIGARVVGIVGIFSMDAKQLRFIASLTSTVLH